ncbi:MAG: hypothetical protein ACRD68_13875, partial [Pyrinomonadaceae bacterium]
MRHSCARPLAFAFVFSLFIAQTAATAQTGRRAAGGNSSAPTLSAAPEIAFTVSMPEPHTHLLQVEMRLRHTGSAAREVDLVMPVWTPGSYLVREYARHVQDFAATDAGGRALSWRKVNKNTWRVQTNDAREWRAIYRVYANELTVRTNELNDRHAFWNNAALLMHVNGHIPAPSTVRVVPG